MESPISNCLTEVSESANSVAHHIHLGIVLFIAVSLLVDYLYMETLLPKIKKEHKNAAFVLTMAGYVLTETVRAIPEILEYLPQEMGDMLQHVDISTLHDMVKLVVH